eukprot:10604323-Heterocapsa_arctica.AAC.1
MHAVTLVHNCAATCAFMARGPPRMPIVASGDQRSLSGFTRPATEPAQLLVEVVTSRPSRRPEG